MACFHIQRLLPEVRARRASHNCSAAIGDGGEKSRSDFRDGVRWAWAKPSLDAITTSSALIGSGSPETFPAPCARPTRARARQKSSKSCAEDAHTPSMRLDSKGPDSGTREFLLRPEHRDDLKCFTC